MTPDGSRRRAPNPRNGHCVVYAGYDGDGPTVVTWGTTVKASWEFHEAYSEWRAASSKCVTQAAAMPWPKSLGCT